MADRPTETAEWASSSTALKTEPAQARKESGFSIEQPSVNDFNWLMYNVYRWVNYFDENLSENTGGQGGFTYTHSSARPRIELPFLLNDTGVLSQIEVLKKTEEAVGGVSGTEYTGSGAVTAGDTTPGTPTSLTFSGGPFNTPTWTAMGSNTGEWNGIGGTLPSYLSLSLQNDIDGNGNSGIGMTGNVHDRYQPNGHEVLDDSRTEFVVGAFSARISDGFSPEIRLAYADDEFGQSSITNLFNELLSNNSVYFIAANSLDQLATASCVIWELTANELGTIYEITRDGTDYVLVPFTSLTPVYKNIDITTSLRSFRIVASYNVTGGGMGSTTGSSLDAAVDLSTVTWDLSAYSYDPTANTLSITTDPAQADDAFHTFKIRGGGQDLITLLESDATFSSGTWTWSGINDDPITSDGTYEFLFETAGSGVNVFRWIRVTTGLSVETYSGVKYLNVSSTAAVNNDVLFVRKI